MFIRYSRRFEVFEAVQFNRINKENSVPEFNHLTEWVKFALDNNILHIDGADLVWGYKELDRRIKPGAWIVRSQKSGALKFRSDTEFKDQFEEHPEDFGS